jgi:hypothetical protein
MSGLYTIEPPPLSVGPLFFEVRTDFFEAEYPSRYAAAFCRTEKGTQILRRTLCAERHSVSLLNENALIQEDGRPESCRSRRTELNIIERANIAQSCPIVSSGATASGDAQRSVRLPSKRLDT